MKGSLKVVAIGDASVGGRVTDHPVRIVIVEFHRVEELIVAAWPRMSIAQLMRIWMGAPQASDSLVTASARIAIWRLWRAP